ncbi:MAG: hypothetical protein RLZZ385_2833 [Pseudomonadota bacterium]
MPRPHLPTIVLYANGNFGKSCLANLVEIYALFYFTDMLGISPSLAGFALLLALALDAITDPLIGHVTDRFEHRWKHLTPYASFGIPLTAGTFLLLFLAPLLTTDSALMFVMATLLAFRAAYTVFDVPHNGLLSVITRTPAERTLGASLRIFFSAVGKLTVTIVVAWNIQNSADMTLTQSGLIWSALVLAVLYLVSTSVCTIAVREVLLHPDRQSAYRARFIDIGKNIIGNSKVSTIFLLTATNSLMIPVISTAFIYYSKYGLGDESIGTRAVMLLAVSQTVSLLFWVMFTNSMQSKSLVAMIAYGFLLVAAVLGATIATDAMSIYAVSLLTGFSVSGVFMLNWSMLPDALDQHQDPTRHSGRFGVFGVYTLTNKTFNGIAQAYLGLVLTLTGYNANSEIASTVIDAIRINIFLLPISGALLCIVLLRNYQRATPG